MAKFTVTVTETYCKAIAIEACDAETAEALIRGQWGQGELDLAHERDTFEGVAFDAEPQDEVHDGSDDYVGPGRMEKANAQHRQRLLTLAGLLAEIKPEIDGIDPQG